jgi:hypothetical protein
MHAVNLSIVAPTCLDEKSLPELLEALENFTLMSPFGVQVLVMDDGGSPRIRRWLAEASGLRPWMTVLTVPAGSGLGAELRAGAAQAAYPLVAWVASPGDRLQDLWEMRRRLMDGADLVVAGRAIFGRPPQLAAAGGRSWRVVVRAWGSWLFSRTVRRLLDLPVADCTNCFRAFRKDALAELSLAQDDFTVGLEMLLKADKREWEIDEIPTVNSRLDDGAGLLGMWRMGAACVGLIVRSWLARLSGGQ